MLIQFKVENFRSIRDEQVLSMVASPDKSLPDNVVEVGGFRLLKSAGIYGANASGKSNVFNAMVCMRDIVISSAVNKPDSGIGVVPFAFDEIHSSQPTTFDITFLLDDIRYQYGFSAKAKEVVEEWLFAYPHGKPQTWFHRKPKGKNRRSDWRFGSFLKGERENLKGRTRADSLFLSVAAQWNHDQLSRVYDWFAKFLRTIENEIDLMEITSGMLLDKENKVFRDLINYTLEIADLGIREVDVERVRPEDVQFGEHVSEEWKETFKKTLIERIQTVVTFKHKGEIAEKNYPLYFAEESRGTQKFFRFLGPWFQTLTAGYCVFVDELAASLHPLLTKMLLGLIHSSDVNNTGAQLVFTTHDTTLMKPEYLRRDQIWFTEKNEKGSTSLYSLNDYKDRPVRKGEPFDKAYMAGRYGAIPIIQSFEDLDVPAKVPKETTPSETF